MSPMIIEVVWIFWPCILTLALVYHLIFPSFALFLFFQATPTLVCHSNLYWLLIYLSQITLYKLKNWAMQKLINHTSRVNLHKDCKIILNIILAISDPNLLVMLNKVSFDGLKFWIHQSSFYYIDKILLVKTP